MFTIVSHPRPSLSFVSKARAFPGGATTNVRLALKRLTVTYTLAYYIVGLITMPRCFKARHLA
jgi:hypothetical protein